MVSLNPMVLDGRTEPVGEKDREERDGRLGRLRKLNWDKEPAERV